MSKIILQDSIMDVFLKLAVGNPGALTVCMEVYKKGPAIDPDAALGGLASLLDLDDLGIYGSHIWLLFKDICGEDLVKTIAVLRARQLGFISDYAIKAAIFAAENGRGTRGNYLNTANLLARVQKRLPKFGKEA